MPCYARLPAVFALFTCLAPAALAAPAPIPPPPSLAVLSGQSAAASDAAEPPLEPPGVTSGFHGERVTP